MRKNHWLLRKIMTYYLSYPKPPVLDMKWGNHDINVVEWGNIPNFLLYWMEVRRKRGSAVHGMLTPTVIFDIFITISHLFVCQCTWGSQHSRSSCAQQHKCTITGNKQLQKNGTWKLRTAHIKQKSSVTLIVVS